MVITEDAAAVILGQSGITPEGGRVAELAAQLDRIAHAFFTSRHFLRGSRGRRLKKIGRAVRVQLFGDLYGFWTEVADDVPHASFHDDTFDGRAIAFAQAYCGALAAYLEKQLARATISVKAAEWRSVLLDLRQIAQDGGKAREGFRLISDVLPPSAKGEKFAPKRRAATKNSH